MLCFNALWNIAAIHSELPLTIPWTRIWVAGERCRWLVNFRLRPFARVRPELEAGWAPKPGPEILQNTESIWLSTLSNKNQTRKDRTKDFFSCVYVYDAKELHVRVGTTSTHSYLRHYMGINGLLFEWVCPTICFNARDRMCSRRCCRRSKSCWGVTPCSLANSSHRQGVIHQKTVIVFLSPC